MIPKEILKKVRRIQIITSHLVTAVFVGQYHSVFKGHGMEFDEVREYQIGDDIRTIDRNVTARTGKAHVKKYVEERELTVMLLVDASMSCRFATVNQLKSQLAAEIAAVLAFAAVRNNDKVGLIVFTDRIEKFIPPRRGIKNVLRVIREALFFNPEGKGTDIAKALDYLNRVSRRKSIAFLISDFFEPGADDTAGQKEDKEPKFKKSMAIANKRHDLVAITLNDPKEIKLTDPVLLSFQDAETGEMIIVDSSDQNVRTQFHKDALDRLKKREWFFKSTGIDHIDVFTDVPYIKEVIKFFLSRRKRRR